MSQNSLKTLKRSNPDILATDSETETDNVEDTKKLDSDIQLYCICQEPDDGIRIMIQCKGCRGIFHRECMSKLKCDILNDFKCPNCIEYNEHIKNINKRKLDILQSNAPTKNNVNYYTWLKDVLERIPEHKANRLEELLPGEWLKANPKALI